jgi:hypothetical protein
MPEQPGPGSKVGPYAPFILLEVYAYFQNQNTIKITLKTVDFSYFGGAESLWEGKQRSPRRTEVPRPTDKDDGKSYPAAPQDPSDFLWLMTEEPHRTRRLEIMKAHPEAWFLSTTDRTELT